MEIRRIAQIKDGDAVVGSRTRVKVVKNKMAPPFREAEFDMTFGSGISRLGEVVDLGEEYGILTKSGSWYSRTDTGTSVVRCWSGGRS
jgi:recombination protein RecA